MKTPMPNDSHVGNRESGLVVFGCIFLLSHIKDKALMAGYVNVAPKCESLQLPSMLAARHAQVTRFPKNPRSWQSFGLRGLSV